MTRTAPSGRRRRALAALACALVLLPLLAAGPVVGPAAAQAGRSSTTTTLLKGDRPTNYPGLGLIALGLVAWATVFAVVLYRSPRRASALRRRDPGVQA